MSESELVREFEAAFPEACQRAILEAINKCYEDAEAYRLEEFPGPEGYDQHPISRRARIERALRSVAERFDGMRLLPRMNRAKNSRHALLHAGNVFLTVHSVAGPKAVPRYAHFRNDYARGITPDLFRDESFLVPGPESPVWWVVTHGPSKKDRKTPGFIQLGILVDDCTRFDLRINLVDKLLRPMPSTEEQQAEPRPIRKRTKKTA